MTKPTEYTLDVSKWRCGKDSPRSLGEGETQMLNEEGYMCCLGQFACAVGVDQDSIRYLGSPAAVGSNIGIYDENFVERSHGNFIKFSNTILAGKLININDRTGSTPQQKIRMIREELERNGLKLTVIDEENILGEESV